MHDDNFVVTGGTWGCHNDNLRYHQWQQRWHHDVSQFSVELGGDMFAMYVMYVLQIVELWKWEHLFLININAGFWIFIKCMVMTPISIII